MKSFSAYLNSASTFLLVLVAFFIPLVVWTETTEYFDTNKLIFLFIVVMLLLLMRTLSWVLSGKVLLTRTPLDIPLILFLVVLIASAANPLNQVKQISLLGNIPTIHGSVLSWVIYILLYFLTIYQLKTSSHIKYLFYALLGSGVVVAVISLFSYLGIYFPWAFTHVQNFTPSGSSFSAAAFLLLLLPFTLLSIVKPTKIMPSSVATVISSLFLITIGLIGFPGSANTTFSIYITAVLTLGLILLTQWKAFSRSLHSGDFLDSGFGMFCIPIVLTIIIVAIFRLPVGETNNILHQKSTSFPQELQLSYSNSWDIAASSFKDSALLGSGPATYLFDFTLYKGPNYNLTPLWNVNFEDAFNEVFQIFTTMGGLGLLAFAFILFTMFKLGWKGIMKHTENTVGLSLSVSVLVGIVLLLLHTSTVVEIVALLTVLAMLMTVNKGTIEHVEELAVGAKTSDATDLLPALLFGLVALFCLFILFNPWGLNALKVIQADYHHRIALNDASTKGIDTYNELIKAEQLNPIVDVYRTDLAQTNFALANALVASKGPTQASPSGSLTDSDKQTIQTLLSQSINEGKAAVTLNPLSAQNWEILGSIYRQISGVAQNALQFSLASYGQAVQRDPRNPLLRLNIGGVYYSAKNYQLAIRFFTDAANLKPDLANAYYNLAIALRDSGDIPNAIAADQQVLTLVDPKSADYQTANTLLKSLQNSSTQTPAATDQPPAAKDTSALQQKNLPNVLNLNQPDQVSTPAAVKK